MFTKKVFVPLENGYSSTANAYICTDKANTLIYML